MTYIAKTKNKSFLQYRDKLYVEGISNSDEVLMVYDEKLISFDLDEYIAKLNDTDSEVANSTYQEYSGAIFEECKKNIWFFFREIFRVESFGNMYIPFVLTDFSAKIIYAYSHKISVSTLGNTRCCGKTVLSAGLKIYSKIVNPKDEVFLSANVPGNIFNLKCKNMAKIYDSFMRFAIKNMIFPDCIFHKSPITSTTISPNFSLCQLKYLGFNNSDLRGENFEKRLSMISYLIIDDADPISNTESSFKELLKIIDTSVKKQIPFIILFCNDPIAMDNYGDDIKDQKEMFEIAMDISSKKFDDFIFDKPISEVSKNIYLIDYCEKP